MTRSLSMPMRSAVLVLLLALVLTGCTKSTTLLSASADRKAVSGVFDLYLYGCRHPNDLETAAFLVDPARAELFDLFVLPTSFKVKKGLPAASAFEQADVFLRCGVRTVEKTVVRSIPDGTGATIGYEILPHFSSMDEGGQRPLLVNYSLRNGKVTVFIRLDPAVERQVHSISPQGPGSP